jgi:hemerythrin
MKDFGFDEEVASGFRSLDGEHHMQLDLLTALRRAILDGRDRLDIDEIFDRLIDYTKLHFTSEQLLMRLHQYPLYQEHVDDHDATVERLADLRAEYLAGNDEVTLNSVDELAEWLVGHIRSADRALGYFLVRVGVGPG